MFLDMLRLKTAAKLGSSSADALMVPTDIDVTRTILAGAQWALIGANPGGCMYRRGV